MLPVVVPEAKTGEFILPPSFLLFLFYFVLSALDSNPSPVSLFPIMFCLTLPLLSSLHLPFSLPYIVPSSLCSLLPHYPFTTCHSVTSLFTTRLSRSPYLSHPLHYTTSPSAALSFLAFFPARSERLRRGDAPVPERRNVQPEPEVHLSSRV